MKSSPPRLTVRVSGEVVGYLSRHPQGGTVWEPDPAWVGRNHQPVLGLRFLEDASFRHTSSGLLPWFENLLPEPDSALRNRLCSIHGLRSTDSLALLQKLGGDLPGAVEVIGRIDNEGSTSQDLIDLEGDAAEIWRFSLAGMQLKFSMAQQGNRFALPARNSSGKWIIKLPGQDLLSLPQVEASTMRWAKHSGLEVPEFSVVSSKYLEGLDASWRGKGEQAFAIKRFDRGTGNLRIHQEDFAQVLGLSHEHKYGDSGKLRPSYDRLVRLVDDATAGKSTEDFVDRVAFVLASGNGDAHLKNWSLQWLSDGSARLSPCYDQVATISWPEKHGWGHRNGPRLGLNFGRQRRFRDVDSDARDTFCKRSGFAWAKERVNDRLVYYRSVWRTIEAEAPEEMRDAIAEHWRRVPLLQALDR